MCNLFIRRAHLNTRYKIGVGGLGTSLKCARCEGVTVFLSDPDSFKLQYQF